MKRSRIALLWVSTAVATVLVGSGLAVRVGAADDGYRQAVLFSEVLSLVTENYVDPVNPDELLGGAFEGMLGGLDARGAYLTPSEVDAWRRGAMASAGGPGVGVLKAFGALQVVSVEPGSPAASAGIQPGDQIRRIGGGSLRDLSLDQATRLLLGPVGSRVEIDILHSRDGFRVETLSLERCAPRGPAYELEARGTAAVLTLHDAHRVDPSGLARDLQRVREEGAQRLLIDARNLADPDVRDAARVARLFVDGALLRLVDRQGNEVERLAVEPSSSPAWEGTIGVLVNGATAGAGEALARLLQTRGVARVFGEGTYGLATEVELVPLPDGAALLLPTRVWSVASGEGWIGDGVEPDTEVEGSGRTPEDRQTDQLQRTLELLGAAGPAAPEAA